MNRYCTTQRRWAGWGGGDTSMSRTDTPSLRASEKQGTHPGSTKTRVLGPRLLRWALPKFSNSNGPLWHSLKAYPAQPTLPFSFELLNETHGPSSSHRAQARTVYSANWIFCVLFSRVLSFPRSIKVVMSQKVKKELTSPWPEGWKN